MAQFLEAPTLLQDAYLAASLITEERISTDRVLDVIGGAAGAMLGSQLEPRSGGYYWYGDRCWIRYGDGSYHRVSHRYCY